MEDCTENGDCRIGQLVTRSMMLACASVPAGCDMDAASSGIVGGGGFAVEGACPGDDQLSEFTAIENCVGSPLVIDLDRGGLALSGPSAARTFSLPGVGALATGWIEGDGSDALLALDRDGSGCIEGGDELFGEATGARDGFAALARYDEDESGAIDANDAVHGELLLWLDDGDARCLPSELSALASVGVTQISLAPQRTGSMDRYGNVIGLASVAASEHGRAFDVYDVWFAIQGH
jgi:hypothetical protein